MPRHRPWTPLNPTRGRLLESVCGCVGGWVCASCEKEGEHSTAAAKRSSSVSILVMQRKMLLLLWLSSHTTDVSQSRCIHISHHAYLTFVVVHTAFQTRVCVFDVQVFQRKIIGREPANCLQGKLATPTDRPGAKSLSVSSPSKQKTFNFFVYIGFSIRTAL